MSKINRSVNTLDVRALKIGSQSSPIKKNKTNSKRDEIKNTTPLNIAALRKCYLEDPQEAILMLNRALISQHPLADSLTEQDLVQLNAKVSKILATDNNILAIVEQILNDNV